MLAAVLQNISENNLTQPVATFQDGYRTAVIVEAIRASSRTGRTIEVLPLFEDAQ